MFGRPAACAETHAQKGIPATKPEAKSSCMLCNHFRFPYLEAIDAKPYGGDLLHPNEAPDHKRPDGDVQREVDEVHGALVRPGFPNTLRADSISTLALGWGYQMGCIQGWI